MTTTERGSHAFHTELIFATSRTDQSILKYPRQFFQKNVNLQDCKVLNDFFFFFFWGGGGDLFREILAFLRRVKCGPVHRILCLHLTSVGVVISYRLIFLTVLTSLLLRAITKNSTCFTITD